MNGIHMSQSGKCNLIACDVRGEGGDEGTAAQPPGTCELYFRVLQTFFFASHIRFSDPV